MEGKVAIVTGAGSKGGIGRSIANVLAQKGATVIIADLNKKGAMDAANQLVEKGYNVIGKEMDVTSRKSVDQLVDSTLSEYRKIDILINNAGITRPTKILDISEKEWDLLFAVNMKGVFNCTQAVLPSMINQETGRIVNLSSIAAKQGGGVFGTSHYAAAKAGVLAFSKAVAREVAEHGITVNSVTPGMIETEIISDMSSEQRKIGINKIPLKRIGTPEEVAATVAFLVSESSGYITGEEIDINGGLLMD